MFRRAVFALMLIGAAFAGGAAINGPGLAWLQRNFAGGPSIIVDPGGPSRPDSGSGSGPLKDLPTRQFPAAKVPSLLADLPATEPPPPSKKKVEAKGPTELALADTPLLPESPSTPASALAPLPEASSAEEEPPIPPLPSEAPKPVPPEPARLPRLDPGPPPKSDPVARLASVERPAPSQSSSSTSTWADLRKRMKDLGVARYAIEGETDGRVRFRCVIPVDGLKAVGHHFEAEGDDESQAAEAALRRIALWKATSSPSD
jgi:hypothetical protein